MRAPLAGLGAVVLSVSFACGGGAPAEVPVVAPIRDAPIRDVVPTPVMHLSFPGVSSAAPQVLDRRPDGSRVALRVETARDEDSRSLTRCPYPGLPDTVDGVVLAVADLSSGAVETWEVYHAPTERRPDCTSESDARTALTAAKSAMASAGLDSGGALSWTPPSPFVQGPRDLARPAHLERSIALPRGGASRSCSTTPERAATTRTPRR